MSAVAASIGRMIAQSADPDDAEIEATLAEYRQWPGTRAYTATRIHQRAMNEQQPGSHALFVSTSTTPARPPPHGSE